MDGLACKEVQLSAARENKDFRIDSPFYTSAIKRNPTLSYGKIGKYLLESQYGISKDMNLDRIGYPIYRMNEIHDMLCDLSTEKCVDIDTLDGDKYTLKDGDVLFNRTNSYEFVGRTGVYYYTGTSHVFASYLVRFRPNQEYIFPEYLASFLSTKYGISEIKRRARQSVNQTNVNPEEVKEIPIPLLNKELQGKIREVFYRAHQARLSAQSTYKKAEKVLHSIFSFNDVVVNQKTYAIKTLKESFTTSGRLDAEYYQPKFDILFDTLSKFSNKRLGGDDGITNIKKSIEPGSDSYKDKGIPFVRVSDVSKYEITSPEIYLSHDVVENVAALFPKKDTILFSKDGSVGIAYKLERDEDIITSGALLHLTVKNTSEVLPDYLTLVLNSPVVQMQAERDSNGAIIQHWKLSEIENVMIPVLDMDKQEELAEMIQESFILRRQSKQLLEYAKRSVEIAIEQGEDIALVWLRQRVSDVGA